MGWRRSIPRYLSLDVVYQLTASACVQHSLRQYIPHVFLRRVPPSATDRCCPLQQALGYIRVGCLHGQGMHLCHLFHDGAPHDKVAANGMCGVPTPTLLESTVCGVPTAGDSIPVSGCGSMVRGTSRGTPSSMRPLRSYPQMTARPQSEAQSWPGGFARQRCSSSAGLAGVSSPLRFRSESPCAHVGISARSLSPPPCRASRASPVQQSLQAVVPSNIHCKMSRSLSPQCSAPNLSSKMPAHTVAV